MQFIIIIFINILRSYRRLIITRSTRNRVRSNKYNDIVVRIVIDAIKGERKSKKLINFTSKTIFKQLTHTKLPNIDDSSSSSTSIITFKTIKTSIKLSIYIINTSIF